MFKNMNDGQGSHLMIEDYRIPWIQIPAVPLRVKSLPSKINVLKIIFLKNYKFLYLKTIDCFVCPDGVF